MRKKTRIIRTTSAVASAALALFLVGLLNVASAPPAAAGCDVSSAESTIHNLVNQARQNAGVPPLTYSCSLDGLALAHSVDMYKHNYFSHMGSDGSTAEQRISTGISEVGYYYGTYGFSGWSGENIYWTANTSPSAAQEAFNWWMNSPGHRANILSPNFTYEGIGAASYYNDKTLFTEDFR